MSGGSMDYAFSRMDEAADDIQKLLAVEEFKQRHGKFAKVADYYLIKNPDVDYLKSPEALKAEVIKRLNEALLAVRKASIYAKRVEWLTSADDGYEGFCLRLDEELAECEKNGGVVC